MKWDVHNKTMPPQVFLDLVESALNKVEENLSKGILGSFKHKRYLIESNKVKKDFNHDNTKVFAEINYVALKPIDYLKWDYIIGDSQIKDSNLGKVIDSSSIENPRFIITRDYNAEYGEELVDYLIKMDKRIAGKLEEKYAAEVYAVKRHYYHGKAKLSSFKSNFGLHELKSLIDLYATYNSNENKVTLSDFNMVRELRWSDSYERYKPEKIARISYNSDEREWLKYYILDEILKDDDYTGEKHPKGSVSITVKTGSPLEARFS